LPKKKDPAAVKLGRKGGKEIAKRGPEYFRQLQARRCGQLTAGAEMEPKFAPEQQGTNLGQPASWISPTSACARSVERFV